MKDILSDYFDKYYGRNKTTSYNATLLTEATRALTNSTNKEKYRTMNSNDHCPFNPKRNRFILQCDNLPKPSLSSCLPAIDNPPPQKTAYNETQNNLPIRKKHSRYNIEEQRKIKQDAMLKVEQLLKDCNASEEDDDSIEDEKLRTKTHFLKEDQVDKLYYIKEKIALDPNNIDLFKSKQVQLRCFYDEMYRTNLMNGVRNFEAKNRIYQPLKTPLIGKNRYTTESNFDYSQASRGFQSFKHNNQRKLTSSSEFKLETNDPAVFRLKGLDTRINDTLKQTKNISEKISLTRLFFQNKKMEIEALLYK